MVTNQLIVRRFMEGRGITELCAKYDLAEWEVEKALRAKIAELAQLEIAFAALGHPSNVRPKQPDPQLTIAEVYGEISV